MFSNRQWQAVEIFNAVLTIARILRTGFYIYSYILSQDCNHRSSFKRNSKLHDELSGISNETPSTGLYHQQKEAAVPQAHKGFVVFSEGAAHRQRLLDFFLTLAICNTVIVAKRPHKDQVSIATRVNTGFLAIERLSGLFFYCFIVGK